MRLLPAIAFCNKAENKISGFTEQFLEVTLARVKCERCFLLYVLRICEIIRDYVENVFVHPLDSFIRQSTVYSTVNNV